MKRRIRTIAMAVFRRGDHILVSSWIDQRQGRRYFRPPGGAVKFGEASDAALRREILEETGQTLAQCQLLGVLEDRFVLDDQPGHEIVFVYDAHFADSTLYDRSHIPFIEEGHSGDLFWLDRAQPTDGTLSPPGLHQLLDS